MCKSIGTSATQGGLGGFVCVCLHKEELIPKSKLSDSVIGNLMKIVEDL